MKSKENKHKLRKRRARDKGIVLKKYRVKIMKNLKRKRLFMKKTLKQYQQKHNSRSKMAPQLTNKGNLEVKMRKEKPDQLTLLQMIIQNKIYMTHKIIKILMVQTKIKMIQKSNVNQNTIQKQMATKTQKPKKASLKILLKQTKVIHLIVLLNRGNRITNSNKINKMQITGLLETKTKNIKN